MNKQKFSIHRLASTKKDIIAQKLKILGFFDRYSAEATRDAFGVSRNTELLWKRKLKEHNYNPSALLPCSRKPTQFKKTRMASPNKGIIQTLKAMGI